MYVEDNRLIKLVKSIDKRTEEFRLCLESTIVGLKGYNSHKFYVRIFETLLKDYERLFPKNMAPERQYEPKIDRLECLDLE